MYTPHFNRWSDQKSIIEFCKANPFAMIVSIDQGENRPVATHVPVMIGEANGQLTCTLHVARANGQWKTLVEPLTEGKQSEVLIVFAGPHAYISPRGYTELDVPTWNYIAVHMYGTARIIEADDEVRERLSLLIEEHDTPDVWTRLHDANEIDPLLDGIVMMDVVITEVQGKRKMSQNRNDDDRAYGEREVLGDVTPPLQA